MTPIDSTAAPAGGATALRGIDSYPRLDWQPSEADIEKFWSLVDMSGGPDACWPWTGKLSSDGYGEALYLVGELYAHRSAYVLEIGPIPPGHVVMHVCDHRPCCNPRCLTTGSIADNNRDRMLKGRSRCAPSLSEPLAIEILARLAAGESGLGLARQYGLSRQTISSLANGHTWKHLPRGRAEDPVELRAAYAAVLLRDEACVHGVSLMRRCVDCDEDGE